jgi:hypothetical protein
MHKALIVGGLIVIPAISGCAVADAFFTLFGHAYSGGGPTSFDRQRDYDQRVADSQAYADAHPGDTTSLPSLPASFSPPSP